MSAENLSLLVCSACRRSGAGPADGVVEAGHAEVGDAVAAGDLVHRVELLLGGLESGFQPGDLAEPAFAAGLGDAGLEVVADLQQPGFLGRVRPKLRAPDTAVLMNAWGAEVPGADPKSDLPELEVVQELVPFVGGEVAVLFAGAQGASAGDEGPVVGDDVLGVDRGISHRGSEIGMSEDLGGDMRREAGAEGFGREEPPEIMRRELQWPVRGVGEPGDGQDAEEELAQGGAGYRPVFRAARALEQEGHRRTPGPLVGVVGGHQR